MWKQVWPLSNMFLIGEINFKNKNKRKNSSYWKKFTQMSIVSGEPNICNQKLCIKVEKFSLPNKTSKQSVLDVMCWVFSVVCDMNALIL